MLHMTYERLTIETKCGIYKSIEILNDLIDCTKFWEGSTPDKPFRGKIINNQFKIIRKIERQNSFLPVIIGNVLQNEIEITMRLNLAVLIPMIGSMGLMGFFGLTFLRNSNYVTGALMLFCVIIGYIMITLSFKNEVEIAKDILMKAFTV